MSMTETDHILEAFALAEDNLVDFRRILLSTGSDEVQPAGFHYEWSDILLNSRESYAIEGFRESAKGQIVLRTFPLFALRFPARTRDYIVLIKQNERLAQAKLLEIEDEYTQNPALRTNIVAIRQKSSKVFSVDVKDTETDEIINVRIEAYGKGASIRGLDNQSRRPRIVVIDDPQDLEDSLSETTMENDWKWFLDDVMFLGKTTRIFLIGNNLGEKCIIERIRANAEDLRFKFAKIAIIKPGVDESSWPEKFSIEEIYKERESFRRLGQLDVWTRERMCEAISQENRIVTQDDMGLRYSHIYLNNLLTGSAIFITADPASSENKESCYRAFCVNAVKKDVQGRTIWHILDMPYGRWASDKWMDVLFGLVSTWHPSKVGIEKGMFEQVIKPFIYQEMLRRNITFTIEPLEHAKVGSKLERCKMLGPRFKAKGIWLPESAPWLAEFEGEMLGMTINSFKSLYTDLIDTLAMQAQIAIAPVNSGPNRNNLGQPLTKGKYDPITHRSVPHIGERSYYPSGLR